MSGCVSGCFGSCLNACLAAALVGNTRAQSKTKALGKKNSARNSLNQPAFMQPIFACPAEHSQAPAEHSRAKISLVSGRGHRTRQRHALKTPFPPNPSPHNMQAYEGPSVLRKRIGDYPPSEFRSTAPAYPSRPVFERVQIFLDKSSSLPQAVLERVHFQNETDQKIRSYKSPNP